MSSINKFSKILFQQDIHHSVLAECSHIIGTKIEHRSGLECKSEMSLSFFCHIFLHLLPQSALVFFVVFFGVNVSCIRKVSQMCVAPNQTS